MIVDNYHSFLCNNGQISSIYNILIVVILKFRRVVNFIIMSAWTFKVDEVSSYRNTRRMLLRELEYSLNIYLKSKI